MENLQNILSSIHEEMLHKDAFLPLCIASSIICYKDAHKDEDFWTRFGEKAVHANITTLKEMYMFYVDFLPKTLMYKESFQRKIDQLKDFDGFMEEFFHSQKKHAKDIEFFQKRLTKYVRGIPNPKIVNVTTDVFNIARQIRFPELKNEA